MIGTIILYGIAISFLSLLISWVIWGSVSSSTVRLIVFMVMSFPAIVLGFWVRTFTMGFDFGRRMAMGLYT